ncbi:hypothetical protein [Calothrix sp. UHCC 0171]|uniref:hypothetical protein n=1 Tax=Calothrix sp. UHCC 0171 TaxID=3110245 RepID=UPI002B1F3854|nr:hypothetical protein [Calothrix sp. UHCC 0171]MEA5573474.1 hypothetical protein [Calothrix sp. UHCC 0171]
MTYATDAFQVSSSVREAWALPNRPKSLQSLNDIRAVEICFEEHEIYVGDRAIAKIILTDEDFETQPWVVIINGIEIHRGNTWMKCFHYITWHFTQGTLPQQEEVTAAEKECAAIPVFIPQHKSKKFAIAEAQSTTITATKLIQKVYAKCVELLQVSIQYLFLLLRTLEKFLRKKRIIN